MELLQLKYFKTVAETGRIAMCFLMIFVALVAKCGTAATKPVTFVLD